MLKPHGNEKNTEDEQLQPGGCKVKIEPFTILTDSSLQNHCEAQGCMLHLPYHAGHTTGFQITLEIHSAKQLSKDIIQMPVSPTSVNSVPDSLSLRTRFAKLSLNQLYTMQLQ